MKRASTDELAAFFWAVHPAGYQFTTQVRVSNESPSSEQSGRFVSPVWPHVGGMRTYAPLLDHPALFRTFATTPETEAGILDFANRYGRLGILQVVRSPQGTRSALPPTVAKTLRVPQPDPLQPPMITSWKGATGESFEAWISEMAELRDMVSTWDATQALDRRVLAQRIEWPQDDLVLFKDSGQRSEVIAGPPPHPNPGLLGRIPPQDLIFPAKLAVQQRTNQKLQKLGVSARLLWDTTWSHLAVHLVPSTLLGCLWLQFARAIAGDKKYRACENCKKWFEIGGGDGGRSDKRFCAGTCKAAAHAKKSTKARKLYRAGAKPAEIAAQLHTSLATVKKWIGK